MASHVHYTCTDITVHAHSEPYNSDVAGGGVHAHSEPYKSDLVGVGGGESLAASPNIPINGFIVFINVSSK